MDKQKRILNLVRVIEWRHPHVDGLRLAVGGWFGRKTKWGKRPIVGSALRDSSAEKARMRQKIARHERAVRMTPDSDAVAVANSHIDDLVYRSFCVGDELLDVCVVRFFAVFADNGHGGTVEHSVTLGQQQQVILSGWAPELIGRPRNLRRRVRRQKLAGVGPEIEWQPSLRPVITWWEVHRRRKLDSIIALVGDELRLNLGKPGCGISEMGELCRRSGAQIAKVEVGRLGCRFALGDDSCGVA